MSFTASILMSTDMRGNSRGLRGGGGVDAFYWASACRIRLCIISACGSHPAMRQILTYSALRRRHDAALSEYRAPGADRRMWAEVIEATGADLREHPTYKAYLKRGRESARAKRKAARLARLAAMRAKLAEVLSADHARKLSFKLA